eukprot:jgi/Psemu1/41574/gm1.41574_g
MDSLVTCTAASPVSSHKALTTTKEGRICIVPIVPVQAHCTNTHPNATFVDSTPQVPTQRYYSKQCTIAQMRTYTEYFQATTASPFGSTPCPADWNEAYNTISQAVGALRISVADPLGESCLRLVHGLRKYPDPLAQPSLNTGNAFGHLDDIEGDAGELVQIPAVQEGAAHSEMISAHKAFFVPFEVAPFLLGKDLSPRQAMGVLYPAYLLNHYGLVGTCASQFDTLRVAGLFPIVPAGDPTLIHPGPSFQSEPGLTMVPRIPPGDPVLAAAVTALTDHQLKLSSEGLRF